MKRHFLAVLALALVAAGCSSSADSKIDVQTVSAGKLTVCTDMPYEPFEFTENGTNKGIDVDILKEIGKDLDLTVEFRDTDFDVIFDEMAKGSCDLVGSSVSMTDERKQKYLFSDGYFEVNQSLMVRTDDVKKYSDLEALAGKKIGVQKATTGADYAAAHAKKSTIVDYDDASEMIKALENKETDGVVQDFPINSYLSQKSSGLKVAKTFTDVAREQYGFVMPMSSTKLKDAVNSSLVVIKKNGRYDQILGDYLGVAVHK